MQSAGVTTDELAAAGLRARRSLAVGGARSGGQLERLAAAAAAPVQPHAPTVRSPGRTPANTPTASDARKTTDPIFVPVHAMCNLYVFGDSTHITFNVNLVCA